jgi:uncharacterized membrane protein YphA (DoxX/SURF4 family)
MDNLTLRPSKTNKNRQVAYFTLLFLLAFFFALSGIWEITKNPITYTKTLKMGYPPYFITALGIAKICGAITLLLPNSKMLKEWAFAGFTFDVIFAFISGLAVNSYSDSIKSSVAFCVIMGTYFLFLENNKTSKI